MTRVSKKIAFISVPHMLSELEEARGSGGCGTPVIVASRNISRGIVLDYSRSLEGSPVRKGIFLKDLGPVRNRARILPADYDCLEELNTGIIAGLKKYSQTVENPAPGEYFIDLTGTRRLFGREIETCGRIFRELKTSSGLTASCGIGRTTLIARMAARVAGEGGVYEIFDAAEEIFFAPLSVDYLPDLSRDVRHELTSDYGIKRVGDLRPFSREDLIKLFGKEGGFLYDYSHGTSRQKLIEKKTEKALKRECITSSEDNDDGVLRRRFFDLVLELCTLMREECVVPRFAEITVVYQDNYRYVTAGRLRHPSFIEAVVYRDLVFYLDRALRRRTCVKKMSLAFSRFSPAAQQSDLFGNAARTGELAHAFDQIRKRFGKKSIGYGADRL
jgi:DNA polymerase-4